MTILLLQSGPGAQGAGAVAGPPTTWNPADNVNTTLSGANLVALANASNGGVRSVHSHTSGKYYWEYTLTTLNQTSTGFGIANASANLATVNSSIGVNACFVTFTGNIFLNGSNSGVALSPNLPPGGQVCCALDMTANLLWIRSTATGQWNGSGTANPATGAGGLNISSIASGGIFPMFNWAAANDKCTANFGASSFVGAVPSGFTSGFTS
jgi:hypothetical protein